MWQQAPSASCHQEVEDGIDNVALPMEPLAAWSASVHRRQMGLQALPLFIGQICLIGLSAHGVTSLSSADFLDENNQRLERTHNESTGQSEHASEFSDSL